MNQLRSISEYIDDRPDEGFFRIHSDVFSDPRIFELEQKYIFGKTWSFLALESQLRKPNDYVTTYIGTTPVLVMRDGKGRLGAFLNICRHKGAVLCRKETGNTKFVVCNYHGWAYTTAGKIADVKDKDSGCYPESFGTENHDLVPLARLDTYKGLVFGCLSPDVSPLSEHLGELRTFIDMAMEQSPQGMEFVPGRITYTYDANWKLQMDNGTDFYHLTSTHPSFMEVVKRRENENAGNVEAKMFDWSKRLLQTGGMFGFRNGHTVIWLDQPQPERRPVYSRMDEIRSRLGDAKAEWMLKLRNMTVFPNMQIADATSLLLRTFRPLAPNKTEMRVFCMAPIGEDPEVRAFRIRQFEDFFNVSGFATPDDTTVYEDCQIGFGSGRGGWLQGYQRGMTAIVKGATDAARTLGVEPEMSVEGPWGIQNETCFHPTYRQWARMMAPALEAAREQGVPA
jgi:benzoate/toluate 1,2-dioxygenase alpha subunit